VVKECWTAMLIKEMEISRLMTHAKQIEEEKVKKCERESKRARTSSVDYSQQKSGGGNRSPFCQKFSGVIYALSLFIFN